MIVVRLVVLGILFYFAWRLLRGITGSRSEARQARREQRTESRVEDVLVEDPVCHKLVPKNQAVRCRIDGKTYYFCSDTCCDKYTEEKRNEA